MAYMHAYAALSVVVSPWMFFLPARHLYLLLGPGPPPPSPAGVQNDIRNVHHELAALQKPNRPVRQSTSRGESPRPKIWNTSRKERPWSAGTTRSVKHSSESVLSQCWIVEKREALVRNSARGESESRNVRNTNQKQRMRRARVAQSVKL